MPARRTATKTRTAARRRASVLEERKAQPLATIGSGRGERLDVRKTYKL
jgi:hypothetical protein